MGVPGEGSGVGSIPLEADWRRWAPVLALPLERQEWARVMAGAVVVLVLAGWRFGMSPWLLAGTLTIQESAAPAVTLRRVLLVLGAGTVLHEPAFGYLYLTLKRQVLFPDGSLLRSAGGPPATPAPPP